MKIYSSVMLICGLVFGQQAWTQPEGKFYLQIGSSHFKYKTLYDNNSEAIDAKREVKETVFALYAEYGISDDFMISTTLPFHLISTGDRLTNTKEFAPEKGDLSALGNISAALTYRLMNSNGLVVSSKLDAKLNTSDRDAASGLQSGMNSTALTPSILAGIGTSDYFASVETGVSLLNNGFSNRFLISGQLGKEFLENRSLIAIASMSINSPLDDLSDKKNTTLNGNASFTGLYLNQHAYTAWNIKLGYKFMDNYYFWASMAGGKGKNIGRAAVMSFALAYKM